MNESFSRFKEEEITVTFTKRRKIQLGVAGAVTAIILLFWYSTSKGTFLFGEISQRHLIWFFLGAVISSLIISLINWRCPSCDIYLGKSLSPKFCPKCGVKLMAEK